MCEEFKFSEFVYRKSVLFSDVWCDVGSVWEIEDEFWLQSSGWVVVF